MTRLFLAAGLAAGIALPLAARSGGAGAQPYPGYNVVNTFPHDRGAFTEGLAFHHGRLFEGTGPQGDSTLRRVELRTGRVKRQHRLADRYFGEGITTIGDEIFQLTWKDHTGWVYDVTTFEKKRRFHYAGEGWGLTDDGHQLAMSNGTEVIRFRDPKTFAVTREIEVTQNGTSVQGLNELEWVGDQIYANVFPGDDVVRIDPSTGEVVGRFNLTPLHEQEQQCNPEVDVTNGIAYKRLQDRLFVTGKYWCHVYEIELTDLASPSPSPTG